MTKAGLLTALNGFISAVVGVTKHRNANNAIVDELFPEAAFQTGDISDLVIEPINYGNYPFQIYVWKQGGTVFIEGWVRNNMGTTVASGNIAKIKNADFYPSDALAPDTSTYYAKQFEGKTPNGTTCRMAIGRVGSDYTLRVIDTFAPNTTSTSKYYFSTFYKTKS